MTDAAVADDANRTCGAVVRTPLAALLAAVLVTDQGKVVVPGKTTVKAKTAVSSTDRK